jgi:nicotinamide-nucleotide amidase
MVDDELLKLAADVGAALKQRGWKLALAESCTGGGAAHAVTDIAGSSAWFERGFVTYDNAAKLEMLGVRVKTLEQFGAVSEQTSREMAQGALSRSHAQISVAISGIAGPDGGTTEKPVGTVCFAWGTAAGQLCSETCHFDGDRAEVRRKSVEHALRGVLQAVACS